MGLRVPQFGWNLVFRLSVVSPLLLCCQSCARLRMRWRSRFAQELAGCSNIVSPFCTMVRLALVFAVVARLAFGLSEARSAAGVPLDRIEGILRASCGSSCLDFFRGAMANASSEGVGLVAPFAGEAESRLSVATRLADELFPVRSRSVAASFLARGRVAATPCSSPASCAIASLAANKCNYGRVALQQAYSDLNVATHVLGALVSSLCGCVHVGSSSVCALKSLPPSCTFPYTVYSKAFAGSVQIWEAVKAATNTCNVHRAPGLQESAGTAARVVGHALVAVGGGGRVGGAAQDVEEALLRAQEAFARATRAQNATVR